MGTDIWEDNAAARKWCSNPVHHAKQKHIEVAHHFIREQVAEFGSIAIRPIESALNISDLATKSLAGPHFEALLRKIMNLGDQPLRPTTTSPTPVTPTVRTDTHPEHLGKFDIPESTLKLIAEAKRKRQIEAFARQNQHTCRSPTRNDSSALSQAATKS